MIKTPAQHHMFYQSIDAVIRAGKTARVEPIEHGEDPSKMRHSIARYGKRHNKGWRVMLRDETIFITSMGDLRFQRTRIEPEQEPGF